MAEVEARIAAHEARALATFRHRDDTVSQLLRDAAGQRVRHRSHRLTRRTARRAAAQTPDLAVLGALVDNTMTTLITGSR
ncbi:hypothetical protein [Nocardia salmonicida]|uniref:hypothetical protein n=1 Tax=Nocardia salmonicida TaxID=53431 RepID=UPI0007A48CE6|nr:hypothetical protein [Nocardia salmonicida]